jgi:DNA topoisomerase-1
VLAAVSLRDLEAFESLAEAKRNVAQAIEAVSRRLGNTASVCRKCYVHPAVLDTYLDGKLGSLLECAKGERHGLGAEESAVLKFLGERVGGAG